MALRAVSGGGFPGIVNVPAANGVDDTAAIQAAIFAAFGTVASPNGINFYANRELVLPPGNYKTTAPLTIPNVQGAVIRGAGRFTTSINNTAGTGVFVTNGFEYGQVRGLNLSCAGTTAKVFDLNWDGTTGVALQSNTFSDMFFNGGAVGVEIGAGGFMGSENLFQNCFWINHATAGLKTSNFNALQNTVIGGNFQSCFDGVSVEQGNVNVYSAGFQASSHFDIRFNSSANDASVVSGCRTESPNFVFVNNARGIVIEGCNQTSGIAGDFFNANSCYATINGCVSVNGKINLTNAQTVTINNFQTGRNDWISVAGVANATCLSISGIVIPAGMLFCSSTTFAMLPSPVGMAGVRGFIKDATVSAFGATVSAGGGTNKVGIRSDDVNWVVG